MAINRKKGFSRFVALQGIMAGLFTILILRVAYLQIFKYEDFKEKADTRSRRFIAEKAPRGKIYDSNGNVLATNKQTYIATFTETDQSKNEFYKTMEEFFKVMDENNQEISDKFDLKIDDMGNINFDFGFKSDENNKIAELRFKKDKGIFEEIQIEKYPKQKTDLNDEQIEEIESEVQNITAEQVFYYLVDKYEMYELLNEYKNRDSNISGTVLKNFKKSIKERYTKIERVEVDEQGETKVITTRTLLDKIESGKRITDDLLKENTLKDIRRYMVIKDSIKMQSFSGFKPVTIAPTISQDAAFILYQKLSGMTGVDIQLEPVRYYPYGELGANFLGYMGAIPGGSEKKYEERGYDSSTDLIGMAGIESSYEQVLRGTKGGNIVGINAKGARGRSLYSMQTTPGNNVHLTIDKDIQYSAEKMLETQLKHLQTQARSKNATRGAVVALEVKTGNVLAMASYPTYDPNLFASGKLQGDDAKNLIAPNLDEFGSTYIKKSGINKTIDELFPKNTDGSRQDPNDIYPKPMFNYATMGLTPPGSTFKAITGIVGMEEGVINPNETINDNHVLGGGLVFKKYPELISTPKDNSNHGVVSLREALQRSCNSYFYEIAVRLYKKYEGTVEGLDSIAKYSWQLGLAENPNEPDAVQGTGIEISERIGSVYNFDGSKDKFKTFSMWDLVTGLKKGQLNSGGQRFTAIDIEKNDKDSKGLKEPKENMKIFIKDEIDKINSLDKTGDEDNFKEQLKILLQNIYDNSIDYQENIKSKNSDLKVQFEIISTEIWNWIQYNVKYQIVNAGNLASAAIGQGDTTATPLQMASAIATIANGGNRFKVNIVDKITTQTGELIEDIEPTILGKFDVSKESIEVTKQGMYMTNHKPTGTAYHVFSGFPIDTAGKTATATLKENQGEVGRTDFGGYVAFAPVDDPEIAVCVVGYDAASGGNVSIVARAIFETYFRDQIKEIAPGYSPRTSAGDAYNYTLYPESMNFKDDGIFVGESFDESEN